MKNICSSSLQHDIWVSHSSVIDMNYQTAYTDDFICNG